MVRPREAQTTDRDRGQPDSFLRVAGVVEHLVTLAVDDIEVEVLEDAAERPSPPPR
jgi:hypothetical protein